MRALPQWTHSPGAAADDVGLAAAQLAMWPRTVIPDGHGGHCAADVSGEEKAGPASAATIAAWTAVTGGGTGESPGRDRRPEMSLHPDHTPAAGAPFPGQMSMKTGHGEEWETPRPCFLFPVWQWVGGHPVHGKVSSSIPSLGTFESRGVCKSQPIDVSLSLCSSLLLPLSKPVGEDEEIKK